MMRCAWFRRDTNELSSCLYSQPTGTCYRDRAVVIAFYEDDAIIVATQPPVSCWKFLRTSGSASQTLSHSVLTAVGDMLKKQRASSDSTVIGPSALVA
jgi:hypothetical protein